MSVVGYFNLSKLKSTFGLYLQQTPCCICVETWIFLCLLLLTSLQFLVFGVCGVHACVHVCVEFKVHIRRLPLFRLKLLRQGFSWNPTYSFSWTSWSAAPQGSPVLLLTPHPAKCWNYFFTHKPPSVHSNKLINGDIFLNPASTRISKWIPVMQNEAVYEMCFLYYGKMAKWLEVKMLHTRAKLSWATFSPSSLCLTQTLRRISKPLTLTIQSHV